jgi:hypothetical protein
VGRVTRRRVVAELGVVSLIVAVALILAPGLRVPHTTLGRKYRPFQEHTSTGRYHFVDDSLAVEEATSSYEHIMRHFDVVLPALAGCSFHPQCRNSAIVVPTQTYLIYSLRRRLGTAEGEDSPV